MPKTIGLCCAHGRLIRTCYAGLLEHVITVWAQAENALPVFRGRLSLSCLHAALNLIVISGLQGGADTGKKQYPHSREVIEKIGGGGWTRTNDLGIMSPSERIEGEEDKGLGSAKSSKVLQNPQQNRNK